MKPLRIPSIVGLVAAAFLASPETTKATHELKSLITDIGCNIVADGIERAHVGDCTGTDDCGDFFRVTLPVGASISLSLCGATWDTFLAIWDGATQVASDDDGCGTVGGASILTWESTATKTYDVEISGWNGHNGPYTLTYTISAAAVIEGCVVDADGDGIPDSSDECDNSDLSPTVVIGGCDSGVENVLLPNGCTIIDLIAHCAETATTPGSFVSCVTHLTNQLKDAGVLSNKGKGAIQSCAAKLFRP